MTGIAAKTASMALPAAFEVEGVSGAISGVMHMKKRGGIGEEYEHTRVSYPLKIIGGALKNLRPI